MKKSLIALAIASSFAGSAFAQSNVQFYGAVDAGFEMVSSGGVDTTKLSSGQNGGSYFGVKGKEDLGGGLKAEFVLESGVDVDTGANSQGLYFGRQSYISVSSNSVGSLSLGRQYSTLSTIGFYLDPFDRAGAGTSDRILGNGTLSVRLDNAVTYTSPEVNGFQANVQYALGEVPGSTSDNNNVGISATYKNGPLMLAFGHENRNFNGVGLDSNRKDLQVGGTYDFGMAKAFVSYLESKEKDSIANTSSKAQGYSLGVSVPMGAHSFVASYNTNKINGVSDTTSNHLSFGYKYALSKRTGAYFNVANITNDRNVALGGAVANGESVRHYQVGLRHTF